MNKKKILAAIIAATMITSSMSGLCTAVSAATTTIVNENFGDSAAESPDAVEGITWGDLVIADAGTYLGKTDGTTTNTGAISLSANADKNLMSFEEGLVDCKKKFTMTYSAATYCYGQADHNWYLTYKDTTGADLFTIKYTVGNWAAKGVLISGSESIDINGVGVKTSFTTTQVDVSFNSNGGGVVTVDGKSLPFETGTSLGSIAITADGAGDQGRPIYMDDITIALTDKYQTTLTVTSSQAGESTAGATVTIGDDTYTADDNGVVSAYFLPGTYDYEVKLSRHNVTKGSFTVGEVDGTADVTVEYVGDPVPTTIEIAGGEEYIYLPTTGNTTSSEAFTATVYDNAGLVMDDAVVEWSLPGQPDTVSIADGVVTVTPEYPLTDDNGVDVIVRATVNYTDKDGAAQSVSQDAEIHIHNTARATSWTIAGPAVAKDGSATTYSVTDVKDQYGNAFEDNCSFVLTSSDPNAVIDGMTITPNMGVSRTEEMTLTVELADTTTVFDVEDGVTAAALIKATYGDDNSLTGVNVENVNISDGKLTLDGAPASNEKYMLWDSLQGLKPVGTMSVETETSGTKMERAVTVYGYDFYEPGTGTASYGEPRMELVNDVNSIVWPKSSSSAASTTITLPEPVKLDAGTAKMITFDNIATTKTVGSQERSLQFKNSAGVDVINIDFAGAGVVKDWSKVDGNYTGTQIGSLNTLNEASSALFVLKTDASGITSAILSYNGSTLDEYVISEEPLVDIASITMVGGQGAPDDRMLTLTNIVISDSDVAEVEIVGDDTIAKISGMTASKKFKGSIFSQAEGETFTWSVADANGDAIEGVTIDQDGVLTVTDAVAADTVAVISYTSSLSTAESPKLATHEVTIKDFASVTSFDIVGPVAVNAGESVTYSVENIVDEYGDTVKMPVSYAITSGNDIASVDAATGVVTTTGTLGKYTLEVTVGNPDKTLVKTVEAEVSKYSEVGETTDASVEVDVSLLANYAADTQYRVTTATADGKLVNQTEVAHTDGKVTVDMTGAAKYEVSPIYSYSGLGNISGGYTIPLCDGLYDFTFKKSEGTRGDIFVNGAMVGNNVDQYGAGKSTSGSYYTVNDVNVQGGSAVIAMYSNATNMDSVVAKKAPSILPRKTHVYLMGDSLVSNYYGTFADEDGDGIPAAGDAQTGWGQVIDKFISDDLNVTNLAESGSTAIGMYGSAFQGILANAKAGDYIIMEAGYNDSSYSSESEMAETLQKVYDEANAKGIIVIFTTPNHGMGHGTTQGANVRFGPKVLEVAAANKVLGVNLSGIGYEEYTASGKSADYWAQNYNVYFGGVQQDKLHLSYHGAMRNARIVAQAIYDAQQDTTNPELAASLANLKIDTNYVFESTDTEGNAVSMKINTAE